MKRTAEERLNRLLKDPTVIQDIQASNYPVYYLYSILWEKPIDYGKIKFKDEEALSYKFIHSTSLRAETLFYNREISGDVKRFLLNRQLELFDVENLPIAIASLINDYELLADEDRDKTIYVDWEKCFDYACSIPFKHLCFFFPNDECLHYLEAKAFYWEKWFNISFSSKLAFIPMKKGRLFSNEYYRTLDDWCDFKHVYEIYYGSKANDRRREILQALEPYPYLYKMSLIDVNFYLKDLNLQKNWKTRLNKLNRFLKEHDLLRHLLAKYSIVGQLNILTIYNRVEEKYGKWAIGYLENQNELLIDFEKIKFALEKVKINLDKLLIKPIDLPEFAGGWQCIELTSSSMLFDEGEYNNHCVGGYSDVIESKVCRIFSFRKDNIRHTVQYCYDKSKKNWQIEQSYGKNNCDKSSYSLIDAKYLKCNELLLLTHLIEKHDNTLETNDFL